MYFPAPALCSLVLKSNSNLVPDRVASSVCGHATAICDVIVTLKNTALLRLESSYSTGHRPRCRLRWFLESGHRSFQPIPYAFPLLRMAEVSLSETFLHTFEGAVSVLFTLLAGYIVARKDYVDHDTIRRLSRLSSSVFLPCLIIVQMGPEITIPNLARLWIIPLWGLVSTIIAHLVGWLGQVVFKLPHWTIVAAGRPNANALPLLLIQSLRYTGVLDHLSPGESVNKILDRAKSLILLNAVVQQTLTFQFAPAVLRLDKNSSNGKGSCERSRPVVHESDSRDLPDVIQDTERVGLLHDCEHSSYGGREEREEFPSALNPIADQPDIQWPLWLLPSQRIVEKVYGWMSAPLIGAIIAILFGVNIFLLLSYKV